MRCGVRFRVCFFGMMELFGKLLKLLEVGLLLMEMLCCVVGLG